MKLPNPQELIKVRVLYDDGKLIVEVEGFILMTEWLKQYYFCIKIL